jgi:tripartite-type tricarboxylate transporter receptor subunit TctC
MNVSCSRRQALAIGGAFVLTPFSRAQGVFPSRPIRIIVPQPPGGGFDFVARILADKLAKKLGQAVVVENRVGAGTVVGTEYAAKSEPDGYTLLTGSISNMALNMGLFEKLPYNSLTDFVPVGLAVSYPYVLVSRAGLPQKSLSEVMAFAKANPRKLTYASAGNGSGQHVVAAALFQQARVELEHIPYRGAQPAYQDLLGGNVDLFFDLWSTVRTYADGGRVIPLAVSSAQRHPQISGVPTLIEAGHDLQLDSWFGLFTQTRTPEAIKERLRKELATVIASTEVSEMFRRAGGRTLALSAAEASDLVRQDVERWSNRVRALRIKPD